MKRIKKTTFRSGKNNAIRNTKDQAISNNLWLALTQDLMLLEMRKKLNYKVLLWRNKRNLKNNWEWEHKNSVRKRDKIWTCWPKARIMKRRRISKQMSTIKDLVQFIRILCSVLTLQILNSTIEKLETFSSKL